MRFTPRTWSLLSVALFIAAIFFWLKGNEYEARKHNRAPARTQATNTNKPQAKFDLLTTKTSGVPLAQLNSTPQSATTQNVEKEKITDKLYPLRLRNTSKSVSDLANDDKALLLANALIDTASGHNLEIPPHLKAKEDPGSYIVQWHGPADSAFRSELAKAKAEIVSYVPNNAYLVKATAEQAKELEQRAGIQTVVPFEPYYKIHRSLLQTAVNQDNLAPETLLRLTLLPGERDNAAQELKTLNAQVLAEERSPFGPQIVIRPQPDSLPAIARMNTVQGIEPDLARKPASDLTRVALGIAANGAATNYPGPQNTPLTGDKIWVNFNDLDVDTNYAGLKGRLFLGVPLMGNDDVDGHGTFVAGLIAGDGTGSAQDAPKVVGSAPTNNFRGMAPAAKLFGLPLISGPDVYPQVLDTFLQETAARTNYITMGRTNTRLFN